MELKLKNSLIKDWRGYKGRPFLISGPCSAETEEQVMSTATQLALLKEVSGISCRHLETKDRPKLF